MNFKKPLIIILILFVMAALAGVLWYVKKPVDEQPAVKPNDNEVATTTEEVDISNWILFDSLKDSGAKLHFTFIYPETWIHKGSIDGGPFSSISFFDKLKYKEICKENKDKSNICSKEGGIAEIFISAEEDKGDYSKEEDYFVGNHHGYLITNFNKFRTSGIIYLPYDKIRFYLPNVQGVTFEFSMVINNDHDKDIFYEILKSIKFLE